MADLERVHGMYVYFGDDVSEPGLIVHEINVFHSRKITLLDKGNWYINEKEANLLSKIGEIIQVGFIHGPDVVKAQLKNNILTIDIGDENKTQIIVDFKKLPDKVLKPENEEELGKERIPQNQQPEKNQQIVVEVKWMDKNGKRKGLSTHLTGGELSVENSVSQVKSKIHEILRYLEDQNNIYKIYERNKKSDKNKKLLTH